MVALRVRTSRLLTVVALVGLLAAAFLAGPESRARADVSPPVGSTVVGTVVRAFVEHHDWRFANGNLDLEPLTWVSPSAGAPVRVPTPDLAEIDTGATVSVRLGEAWQDGAFAGDAMAPVRLVRSVAVVAPPPAPAAAASHAVTVALVAPAGTSADSTTLAQVQSQVDGPVAQFWSSQTDGEIQLGVADAHDWLATTASCADPLALWNEVAQAVGFTPGAGKHLLLYLPSTASSCTYAMSTIGDSSDSGGIVAVRDTATSVIAHGLGHNFGLGHSGDLLCPGTLETGDCDTNEYGDLYDVMGMSWGQLGSLNAVQAEWLGVLPASEVQELDATDATTTVTLDQWSGTTGTRALRLTASDGTEYLAEYRTKNGQDAYLDVRDSASNVLLPAGVLVRRVETDSPTDASMLLDGSPWDHAPGNDSPYDKLVQGTPVVLAGGEFTLTVSTQGTTTAGIQVVSRSPITVVHDAAGGDGGSLGAATGAESCAAGVCSRDYEHGSVYWSAGTGAHAVTGAVRTAWSGTGGASGWLGLPSDDLTCGLARGGCRQTFQHGVEAWSPGSGAHPVNGALRAVWAAAGSESGWLGYPTSDAACGLAQGGCKQSFETGAEYWSPASGAHPVNGGLRSAWNAVGAEGGWLGYPTSDAICGLRGGGCLQIFQTGVEYWSPSSGTHAVNGALRAAWAATGSENGWLGYPTSDAICGLRAGGCLQIFQTGVEYWSPSSGTHPVNGALRSAWGATGSENGWLGYPTGDAACNLMGGGCRQPFQGGVEYWSPWTGAHAVNGALRSAWEATGAERGWLGYPAGEARCDRTGCLQAFQLGNLFWYSATGRVTRR